LLINNLQKIEIGESKTPPWPPLSEGDIVLIDILHITFYLIMLSL